MRLDWGRHYLMCPPDYFGVEYEINPWMSARAHVDRVLAREQWDGLVHRLQALGATVEVLAAVDGLPDLVFTANAGLVNGRNFYSSRFLHSERRGETPIDNEWFSTHDYRVYELSTDAAFEGAGDALPFADLLVAGFGPRSSHEAHKELALLSGSRVVSLELVDDRLYHLDLGFCPLDDHRALVAPLAFGQRGIEEIATFVPDPIYLEDDEALLFCANSLVLDDVIVMGAVTPRLRHELESRGFQVLVCPVDEFLKAGGGCRCLTLALDVQLHDLETAARERELASPLSV